MINYNTYLTAEQINEDLHIIERGYGMASVPSSVNAIADSLNPFVLTSGNNTWGTAIPVVGSADTPIMLGTRGYHPRGIQTIDFNKTTVYKIRYAWGASYAAGVAAGNYIDFYKGAAALNQDFTETNINMPVLPSGTILWAACWNATNLATFSFMIRIHEHDFVIAV